MAVNKIDPKVIFASEAPAQDTPAVFTNRTIGWGETRKNGGRPTIKQMNAEQQSTDLKILWLNENAVTPYDSTIDYPLGAVTIKDDVFKIFNGSVWEVFLDKTDIGLGDVDNTSDLNKPISTATQTALDLKADKGYVDNNLPHNNLIGRNSSGAHEAVAILNNSGENQQQINDRGGAIWYSKSGGYNLNDRVVLNNGDEVKSTEPDNTTDPNVDMTGWELDPVALKYTEVASSIKRKLSEVVYDLVLDVTWFGARADHNFRTGAGTVNDVAFQNCISFIGSLGSIRDSGKVKVKIPSGPYQLKHIDIPTFASMGFGLEFVGDGANSTALYFDESYTEKEAITCNMEGVVFRGIALNGSLTTIAVPTGRTKAIYAKNLTNNADIDISFIECSANAWDDFAHIYGRGFVWRGGQIAHVARFLVLHNDVYNNSTPTKPNNIMRHYRIQGTRVDAVGLLMKVEGSNPSQQINNVNITINDFYSLDRLINFEGHTINGLVETGNSQLHSFATSMIRGTHLKNSVITGACLLHRADASEIPTTDGECIGKLVDLLGDSVGNVISGNVIKNLRENIIHVRGASIGNIVSGNTLPECWSRSNTAVERVLCLFEGSVRTGNIVKDNAVTSSVFSGVFRQTNIPLASLGANIVKDNTSPWAWADAVQTAFLSVFAGAVDITSGIAVDSRICRFVFNGDYIEGVVRVSANTVETGAISATLPIAAISDIPTATSAFGGCGAIANITGFTAVGYVPAALFVNAATDRFEFYKLKDMTRTAINWSDGSGARTIDASFRYRYK